MSALSRTEETGPPLKRKMLSDTSSAIFQQSGASDHHFKKAQKWCSHNTWIPAKTILICLPLKICETWSRGNSRKMRQQLQRMN
uniref:Uncharacterized protein n=1 Tax=Lepeophtheirus salmonis TaxID=72036 RepID=A0A0K2TQM6_LEPSM